MMHTIKIPAGVHTRYFVLGDGVLQEVPELLRTAFPGLCPWLVADENTYRAAGGEVFRLLNAAGMDPLIGRIFPGQPILTPDNHYADELAAAIPANAVPVAIGSGVINDLMKRAAGIRGVNYCCIATAASVDGYTSSGAALLLNGRKLTQPCPAPYAILADTRVLESAPREMMAAGYGDLMAKVPAGAEWKIAESLDIEPIPVDVWNMVQHDLKSWVTEPGNLMNIFTGLAATGYALQLYGDSRPGSGAEHLISHVLDMEGFTYRGEEVSHGFKVAIGTVVTTCLLEFITGTSVEEAAAAASSYPTLAQREEDVAQLLQRGCYGDAGNTAMEKFLSGPAADERRRAIYRQWDGWNAMIAGQLIPTDNLCKMLAAAGCPAHPREIGLSAAELSHAIYTAQLIRKRYTVLDVLYEAGLLKLAVTKLINQFYPEPKE